MGGTISVESEYEKGSIFRLSFMQGYVGAATIGKEISGHLQSFSYTDRNRTRNLNFVRIKMPYAKVLVVDDVVNNLDVMRGILKPYEIQVDCVLDGRSAIDIILAHYVHYDAIFMDHMMPDMDGLEATRIIREEIDTDYARNIPIVAVTANAIVGNEEMFLANGFQAFLSKPIDIVAVDSVLRRWVRDKDKETDNWLLPTGLSDEEKIEENRRLLQDRRSGYERRRLGSGKDAQWLDDKFAKLCSLGIDVKQGLSRFGEDEETYMDVLTSYAKTTPELFDKMRTYRESDMEKYAVVLHGIKGSSRNIGAEVISSKAEALEKAARANDKAYVDANNDVFVDDLTIFIVNIVSALTMSETMDDKKECRAEPDHALLAQLKTACESYDMNGIDATMDELKSYRYEKDEDLIAWLDEQVLIMGFDEIVARL
jgi:CheY-like chemotaxis protein/HPt (histidine-containing phosphotransfer) domain-containing protein